MDSPKEVYESCGAIAEALPEEMRAEFAVLVDLLSISGATYNEPRAKSVRRWLRDSGYGG